MTSDSNRNFSPVTGSGSALQAKKRVRYVLPKGCIIGGSYCIEKPLGHGDMGEVYLARHMKLDIYRAIKILLPKIFCRMFLSCFGFFGLPKVSLLSFITNGILNELMFLNSAA